MTSKLAHKTQKREGGGQNRANGSRQRARRRLERLLAAQGILLLRPAEVGAYLRSHADLAKVVPAICAQVRNEFGPGAALTLQVYPDPEIKNRHLSLYVRLPQHESNILDRMDRITDSFNQSLSRASGSFLLTTDLCPPGGNHGV